MRFKLSGFVYGLGTGIIVLSLLYYTVYNFNLSDMLTAEKQKARLESAELTDVEIEELARGIGMIYPAEAVSFAIITIPDVFEVHELSEILVLNRLISDAEEFTAYVLEKGAKDRIKSGNYIIEKAWGFDEILNEISSPAA